MVSEARRDDFVERMGGALTSAGLARLPSRVFSALLVDDDGRMTAAEIAGVLDISAGGVSGAVKYLEQLGMVRRERERGSRRDVFVVDDDAWHGTMLHSDQIYAPMVAALTKALDELPAADPVYRRLRLSREFIAFVTEEMGGLSARWTERLKELDA